jgi:hypothetical protein
MSMNVHAGRHLAPIATAAVVLGLLAAGCGDAGECLVEEGCPHFDDGVFDLPEGGELRLELVQYAAEDGTVTERLAGQGFWFGDQTPEARPLDGPQPGPYAGTSCFDFTSRDRFDNGYTEENQAIADTRRYLDVGPAVGLTSQASGATLTLARTANGVDPSAGLRHDLAYLGGTAAELERNAFYGADDLPGSDEYPAWDLRRGTTVLGTSWTDRGLFVPPDFAMTSPTDEAFFAGLSLSAGEDLALAWDNDAPIADGAPENIAFVAFYRTDGSVAAYCFEPDRPAGAALTVPGEVVAAQDAAGELVVGKFTHVTWNQGLNSRGRFDFIGVTSKRASYQRVPE